MRRLSLILSDFYLPMESGPEEAGTAMPAALDLPNLDWLLRFARANELIHDWRTWLSADLGDLRFAQQSVAQACAFGLLQPEVARHAWLATPVHLEARLDHVRLADRGLLRVSAQENRSWCEEFARAFGPDYALHGAGECGFLLTGLAGGNVVSVDPARLLDSDIGHALPKGAASGELRRLGTEIEMWLHGAPLNTARARRVSALWLWGGGQGKEQGHEALAGESAGFGVFRVHGRDPYLLALARLARQNPVTPAPSSLGALGEILDRVVVELAPMSGTNAETLAMLDANWLAPARAALNAGSLDALDLVANDRCFHLAPRPGWRVWRRQTSWLTQLGRRASKA
jgi:hypothetical protein